MVTNITADPVQLFTGLIFKDPTQLPSLRTIIASCFNSLIDIESDIFPFHHSTYYSSEMGSELYRVFFGFKDLIYAEDAFQYKCQSVDLENTFKCNGKRVFNLDPGQLSLHNLILYSTKNYAHRIACQRGIYAEVTLLYRNQGFHELEWTYPDFKYQATQQFFLALRKHYYQKLRSI